MLLRRVKLSPVVPLTTPMRQVMDWARTVWTFLMKVNLFKSFTNIIRPLLK
jgi:hypothetical protein